MSEILSDDDIKAAVRPLYGNEIAFEMAWPDMVLPEARAVERAVVEKLAAMGGELPTFDATLREAEGQVRASPLWKRFIDGTPLSNDIAVWMTVFAQHEARTALARGVAAGMAQERARCVAVCDGLAEIGQVLPRDSYSKGWRDALLKAEQAISKPENDEEELM